MSYRLHNTDDDAIHGIRTAEGAMIATGHPLAALAAARQLKAGGTAVDAAIAADAVLGVVEPMATGLGGDILAMIVPINDVPTTYNGTGRAPYQLTPDMVAQLPMQKIPERHPLSITTPGVVQGWHDLHQAYGNRPWHDLFVDAIALAKDGFNVSPVAAREWDIFKDVITKDAGCARLYRADNIPAAGDIFINPALGQLLQNIATHGPDAFYTGAIPEAAEKAAKAHGGVLSAEDFHLHTGHFCAPVTTRFKGVDLYECPPNTHGLSVLHTLDALNTDNLDATDPHTWVRIVEKTELAMQHARKVVADPAGNTVCTVIVDKSGFAITLMSSIFKRFGAGIAVEAGGFVLQNRAHGFSAPGHINGVAPGKRPYHTVIPAAALHNNTFLAGFGVVGGAMQPQGHIQMLIRLFAWHEPLQQAINAPRWRLEADRLLAIEDGMPSAITDHLRQAGFVAPTTQGELGGRSDFGGAQFVVRGQDGCLYGGSDKRKDGMALAVE